MSAMTPQTTPVRLDLKRDEKLEIEWQDGTRSVFTLSLLRSMCPCAQCRETRSKPPQRKTSLTILPGNYAAPLAVVNAELVGNYALRIDWSDNHSSGIYSFEYLRELTGESTRAQR